MAKKTIDDLRTQLRDQIQDVREHYPRASVQIQVGLADAKLLFSAPHPKKFKDYPAALDRDPPPSHFLFFADELESILDHEPEAEDKKHKPQQNLPANK